MSALPSPRFQASLDAYYVRSRRLGERLAAFRASSPLYRAELEDGTPEWWRATEADVWAEALQIERREERAQRWKGAWALLTTEWGPDDWRSWRQALWIKSLCLLAMLLGRRKSGDGYLHGDTVASWDRARGYGSWSCWCLDFSPSAFRYDLYRDGDTTW